MILKSNKSFNPYIFFTHDRDAQLRLITALKGLQLINNKTNSKLETSMDNIHEEFSHPLTDSKDVPKVPAKRGSLNDEELVLEFQDSSSVDEDLSPFKVKSKLPDCYYEDCNNKARDTCQALICCRSYGCGKDVCVDHLELSCVYINSAGAADPTPCLECAPAVKKISFYGYLAILGLVCVTFLILWVVFDIKGVEA